MATKKEVVSEETEVVQVAKTEPKKTPRKYAPDEMITCRSITYGELLLTGTKSKLLYSWANYGDTTEVEYQDLQALKSTRSSYLFKPRFVIEDEELVEQWGKDFADMYKNIVDVDYKEGGFLCSACSINRKSLEYIETLYKLGVDKPIEVDVCHAYYVLLDSEWLMVLPFPVPST